MAVVFRYPETEPLVTPELAMRSIGEDPIKVVLPADHSLAGDGRVDLSALREERWVAGCVRCSEHLQRVCARSGFQPDTRHATDDYVVAQALVADGLAVTLLPRLALQSYRHPKVAVLDADAGSRQLMIIYHRESIRTPAIAASIAALTAAAPAERRLS